MNSEAVVAVTGCYAQLKPKEILDIEGVDIVVGADQKGNLFQIVKDYNTEGGGKLSYSCSILLTIFGLCGFSVSSKYWMLFIFAVPYGLGAGAIDSAVNHYVANNYSGSVMNFLHCFYGVGAVISPNIMAAALRTAR